MKHRILPFVLFMLMAAAATAQNVGVGTNSPSSKLDISGDLSLRDGGLITVSSGTITLGTTKNSVYRISSSTAYSVTTISGGNDGMILTLINTGTGIMTVTNGTGNILTNIGANLVGGSAVTSVTLLYNASLTKWIVTAAEGFVSSSTTTTNIYTSDGTLAGNRTVTMGADNLTFSSSTGNLVYSPSSTGNVVIGSGDGGTPAGGTLRGPNSGATNVAGGTLTLAAGYGNGSGAGGSIYVYGGSSAGGGTQGNAYIRGGSYTTHEGTVFINDDNSGYTSLNTAGGYAGIGIAVPISLLHMKAQASANSFLTIDVTTATQQSGINLAGAGTNKSNIYFDPTTGTYGTNGALLINNIGSTTTPNTLLNYQGGNVGIGGVAQPTYSLQIKNATASGATRAPIFYAQNSTGYQNALNIGIQDNLVNIAADYAGTVNNSSLTFSTNPSAGAGTTTERMRVNYDGSIIVGSGEASTTPTGNTLRAPSANASSGNYAGGSLSIAGGNSYGAAAGGNVSITGGLTTTNGTNGSIVIRPGTTVASGATAGNVTINDVASGASSSTYGKTSINPNGGTIQLGSGTGFAYLTAGVLSTATASNTLPLTAGTGITIGASNTINSYWTLNSSSNLYNNNSGGLVGIGQSVPTSPLHIYQSGNTGKELFIDGPGGGTSGSPNNASLGFGSAGTVEWSIVLPGVAGQWSSDAAVNDLVIRPASTSQRLLFNENGGNASIMAITNGAIGISTASPASELANTTTNPIAYDGNGINSSGLTWSASSSGYVADFYNSGTCSSCDGLAVKLNSGSSGKLLDLSVGAATSYSSSSTSVMVAQANGYVGIDNSSPGAPLDVHTSATAGTGALIAEFGSSTSGRLFFYDELLSSTLGGRLYFGSGNVAQIQSGGAFAIMPTGNVGIGTTTPQTSLEVSAGTQDLLKITSTTGGTGNHAYIDFSTFATATNNYVDGKIGVVDMGNNNGSIVFEVGNQSAASGTTTERMRIVNTGAVAFNGSSNYGTAGNQLFSNGNAPPTWSALNLAGGSNYVTGVLPVANGGTGSSTQGWVDLTSTQSAGGVKTWTSNAGFGGCTSPQAGIGFNTNTTSGSNNIGWGTGSGSPFTSIYDDGNIHYWTDDATYYDSKSTGTSASWTWSAGQTNATTASNTSGATPWMTLTNGYLGIGTASTTLANYLSLGNTSNSASTYMTFSSGNGSQYRQWQIGVPYGNTTTTSPNYGFTITDLGNSGTPPFTIDFNTHNVGINTTGPAITMDVSGSMGIKGAVWDHMYLTHDGSTGYLRVGGAETNGLALQVSSTNSGAYGSQTYTNVMNMTSDGNIHVGDATNALNPYILPYNSSIYLRLGNSSLPVQDIFNNYSYVKNWVAIGKSFGGSASAALDAEGNTNSSGTVTGANGYIAYFTNGGTSQSGTILTNVSSNQNNCRYMECEVNGSEVGCLYGNGSNALNIYSASDQRLKKDIKNTSLGLNEVMKIPVREYTWKDGETKVPAGFVAQELYKVYPDAVLKGNDETDLDTKKGGTWMVNYAGITPLLTKAIQDQQAEIEQLKKENASMSSQNSKLQSDVDKLKASVETMQQLLGSKAQK